MLALPCFQLTDVVDGNPVNRLANHLATHVETRHDIQSIVHQTMVLHKGGSKATGTDDHCIVLPVESEKVLEFLDQTVYLVANAGFAANVEVGQILGNL